MFQLQPGDIVELSSKTLLKISQDAPELFQRVLEQGTTTAMVSDIAEDEIAVDLCGVPVHIKLDPERPWRTVRLFKRKNDDRPLDEMPPAVADDVIPEGPPIPQLPSGFAAAVSRGFPGMFGGMPGPPFRENEIPLRVQFAHAIFVQFIIIRYRQQLQQQEPRVSGEEWKEPTQYEPKVRELDVPEQKLYEAALTTMVRWLGEDGSTKTS